MPDSVGKSSPPKDEISASSNHPARLPLEGNVLTADEVAQILRVSSRTVTKLAAAGTIRGKRVGTQWRFLRSAVEQYMDTP